MTRPTNSAPTTLTPDSVVGAPITVYPSCGMPCPVCGHVPHEFAHLRDGAVIANHLIAVRGKVKNKFCYIQRSQ